MDRFSANIPHDHSASERIGVLVTNLGTPDAPTAGAVRRYLAEFLADPRVIEIPRWVWRLILHGVILRVRPRRSARAYATISVVEGVLGCELQGAVLVGQAGIVEELLLLQDLLFGGFEDGV